MRIVRAPPGSMGYNRSKHIGDASALQVRSRVICPRCAKLTTDRPIGKNHGGRLCYCERKPTPGTLRTTCSPASCIDQTGASPFSAEPWSCACHGTGIKRQKRQHTIKVQERHAPQKNVGLFGSFGRFMRNYSFRD